jgi:hypothetical protein
VVLPRQVKKVTLRDVRRMAQANKTQVGGGSCKAFSSSSHGSHSGSGSSNGCDRQAWCGWKNLQVPVTPSLYLWQHVISMLSTIAVTVSLPLLTVAAGPAACCLPPQIQQAMSDDLSLVKAVFRQMVFERSPGARP